MPFDGTLFETKTLPAPETVAPGRARLKYLRDFLLTLPAGSFYMADWPEPYEVNHCGAPACIAGWAEALWFPVGKNVSAFPVSEIEASLGMSAEDSQELFMPLRTNTGDGQPALHVRDPRLAAQVIDHYLETGVVDWSVARSV